MRGGVSLEFGRDDIRFELALFHNINIIVGNGGTGKTTIVNLLNEILNSDSEDAYFKCNKEIRILSRSLWDSLNGDLGKKEVLYIVDEDFKYIRSKKFINQMYMSGACFLVLCRSINIIDALIDIRAIYSLYSEKIGKTTYNRLKEEFKDLVGKVERNYGIKTEDSKSGHLLLQEIGYKCEKPLGGNNKIIKLIRDTHSLKINLVVDTVAFGSFIPSIRNANLEGHDIRIADCESIEYILLHNNDLVFNRDIMDYKNCMCDFSWGIKSLERFYTSVYTKLIKSQKGIDYDKSTIYDEMIDDDVRDKIFSILWKPSRTALIDNF